MSYVPDPTNVNQPTADQLAESAAAEFRALKAYVQTLAGNVAQLPAGAIFFLPGTVVPAGYLPLEGGLYDRAVYPRLWDYIQISGNLVADGTWLAGKKAAFSSGDGASTFRLPDWRDQYIRAWAHGTGVNPGRTLSDLQLGMQINELTYASEVLQFAHGEESGTTANIDGGPGTTGTVRTGKWMNVQVPNVVVIPVIKT